MGHIISINLDAEITQAEYCRRTGDTLGNLAAKLKKLPVRDIPELGIKLINISQPNFDSIRIEAPLIRDYSITELSNFVSNLLSKLSTDNTVKDSTINKLERIIEEMTIRAENLEQDNEQLRDVCDSVQSQLSQTLEILNGKEGEISTLKDEHSKETARFQSEIEYLKKHIEDRDREQIDLKEELKNIKREKDELEKSILEAEKKNIESSLAEEFKVFKEEVTSILNNMNLKGTKTK